MRTLLAIILVAAFGWSAYWWVGSGAKQAAITGWLQERRDAGWVANYDQLDVRGFPNRFDTRVLNLELADPTSGWAWSAPEFQVLALSYQPNHIISVWPKQQTIASPYERITINSADMRASVLFEANTSLALDRTTLTIDGLELSSTKGWTSRMEKAVFATRQSAGEKFAHDIAFEAKNLVTAAPFKARIDPDNLLPDAFQTVSIKLTAAFDAPWDLAAVEGATPALTRLDIDALSAIWGSLELQAKGSLDVDRFGYPEGKIAVRARNWREMLRLAAASGAIGQTLADTLTSGLGLVARLSGNRNTLDVPLTFSDRTMSIGPIPIGPAPRLFANK
jgi:hypothetical protein